MEEPEDYVASNSTNGTEDDTTTYCDHGPFDSLSYSLRVQVMVPTIVFGYFANAMNIAVFRHERMRNSLVNWYLVVLACSDLAVLTSSICMFSLPAIVEEFYSLFWVNLGAYVQRWTYAFGNMAQSFSVGMTLLVSSHRFVGVCFPFLAQRLCTIERVKYAIMGVLVFVTIFNLPRWWEIQMVPCVSKVYNTTAIQVIESSLRYNHAYYAGYNVCAYTIFMFALPFVLLIFMNAMIIRTVHKSYRIRQQMVRGVSAIRTSNATMIIVAAPAERIIVPTASTQQSAEAVKEHKTTIMLIAVVFVFLLCNSLAFINNILEVLIILRNFTSLHEVYMISVEISNYLVVVNSTCNIFIYWTFSVKFRRLLKRYLMRIFCTVMYNKRQPTSVKNSKRSYTNHSRVVPPLGTYYDSPLAQNSPNCGRSAKSSLRSEHTPRRAKLSIKLSKAASLNQQQID